MTMKRVVLQCLQLLPHITPITQSPPWTNPLQGSHGLPPGGFKSFLWKVLKSAKTKRGDKTTVVDFSPKAITTNELHPGVQALGKCGEHDLRIFKDI